jgi:hypothetical protein
LQIDLLEIRMRMKYLTFALVFALSTRLPAVNGASGELPSQWELDPFGGIKSYQSEATGWFRLEQIRGRYFWITPDGHPMFSLGVTHAVDLVKYDDVQVLENKFDNDRQQLASHLVKSMRSWGYNTSGYGTLTEMMKQIPYVATIWTIGPRSHSAGEAKSGFSDIFDAHVQEQMKTTVEAAVKVHKDNRFCMGYLFVDLPMWVVVPIRGSSYLEFIRKLPVDAPGRRVYADFLTHRHAGGLREFNQAYGLDLKVPGELFTADLSQVSPVGREQVMLDDEAFMNIIADLYYRITIGTLRAADPNHLVLGDRLMEADPTRVGVRAPDSILKTAAKYVDVISFQPLGTRELKRDYIDHVYTITGKPVAFIDVNTMTRRPCEDEPEGSSYEVEGGERTVEFYLDAASSPYLIALHRCTIRDHRPWDMKFYRQGLLKDDHTEHELLVDYTRKTNEAVHRLVYGGL